MLSKSVAGARRHSPQSTQSTQSPGRKTLPGRPSPIAASLLLAFAAPLAQSAFAQSTTREATLPEVRVQENTPRDEYAPATSTVGGKAPTPIRDIPQTVTVINRAVMDAQGAGSLADVLRSVPGITIGAAEGGAIGNNINLRGFSARTDIYLDGVRDRGQYYRDVFALDAVEVLKGPSSMLFGRGSTGGVINQVSKTPSLKPASEVSVTAGSSPSLRLTADINRPLSDTSAFRVAMMGQEVDSTRDVMENRDFGIAPSLRFGIGTPTEVTLSGLFAHNRDMPDYGIPAVNGRPAEVDRHKYYGLTDDRTIQNVAELGLKVQHKIREGQTLQNRLQYASYRLDMRQSGPGTVGTRVGGVYTAIPGGNSNGNRTAAPTSALFTQLTSRDRVARETSLINQTDLISEFSTGAVKHTLVTGVELGRETFRSQASTRADLPALSLTDPVYQATPGNVSSVQGNLAQSSGNTVAAYVNDTLALSRQWKLVGGLRWDRFDASITNSVNAPASAGRTDSFTSVRTGVIYQPTDTQSYYASYGTSANPSLETLTVTNGQQALAPVENRSYEVGAKWDLLEGNLSLNSAVFDVQQKNARSQVATGVFELTGDVRVTGFELGVAGRITPRWNVFGGYTYMDPRIERASAIDGTQGKRPANTPTNTLSLWTTYNVSREWEAGGGVTTMSNRFANNTNVVSVGNYARADAMIAYHQPKYDVRVNLLNLTNRRNIEQVIPSDGGRAVPALDRTLLVTLTHRF
jgi:catecholate siderophore receptor